MGNQEWTIQRHRQQWTHKTGGRQTRQEIKIKIAETQKRGQHESLKITV